MRGQDGVLAHCPASSSLVLPPGPEAELALSHEGVIACMLCNFRKGEGSSFSVQHSQVLQEESNVLMIPVTRRHTENHGNRQPNKTHGKGLHLLKQDPGNPKLSEAASDRGLAEVLMADERILTCH